VSGEREPGSKVKTAGRPGEAREERTRGGAVEREALSREIRGRRRAIEEEAEAAEEAA